MQYGNELRKPIEDAVYEWGAYKHRPKTLRDFQCQKCGYILRLYLTFTELARPRFCDCGGEMKLC